MTRKKTYSVIALVVCVLGFFASVHESRADCFVGTHDDVICPRGSADNNNATSGGQGPYVAIQDPGPSDGPYIPAPQAYIPMPFSPPGIVTPPATWTEPNPQYSTNPPPPVTPVQTPTQPPACQSTSGPTPPSQPNSTPTPQQTPPTTGGCADFMKAVRQSENSGSYTAHGAAGNSLGCVGAYQFCPGTYEKYSNGMSRQDFINCPSCQDSAALAFWQKNWSQIKAAGGCSKVGQTVNGVPITISGLVGGSHLGGVGSDARRNGVVGWMDSGTDHSDGGTTIGGYVKKFSGYDLSSCGFTCP